MIVELLSPTGTTFQTLQPTRASSDPALPAGGSDLPNPGVSVLSVTIPNGGSETIQVCFSHSISECLTMSTDLV